MRLVDILCPADMMRVIKESSKNNVCIPSVDVDWLAWKDKLGEYFTMPSGFPVSQFHEFCFSAAEPGVVRARKLSTSATSTVVNLLKPEMRELRKFGGGLTASFRVQDWDGWLEDRTKRTHIKELALVPSKHKNNRRQYLFENIVDRYFKDDEEKESAYFADGTEGLK